MKILLTNDDGIFANGLCALYETLSLEHDVFVVAPDSEKSAVGHAITISDPLRVREVKRNGIFYGWAVNGTPADCVKLALSEIIQEEIDIVVSGINRGANVGINVLYSGTVSAATEAVILGRRAMAVSLNSFRDTDYCYAAYVVSQLLAHIDRLKTDRIIAYNVNIPDLPPKRIQGIKFVKQDTNPHKQKFKKNIDPRGNIYYWQDYDFLEFDEKENSDVIFINRGYITVTPIYYDLTAYDVLNKILSSEISINI